jgi:hypothetical protein
LDFERLDDGGGKKFTILKNPFKVEPLSNAHMGEIKNTDKRLGIDSVSLHRRGKVP